MRSGYFQINHSSLGKVPKTPWGGGGAKFIASGKEKVTPPQIWVPCKDPILEIFPLQTNMNKKVTNSN